jgi:acetylornithine deacetylase/succinyl-diaminopimelate desuccinylase-like protein
MKSGLASMMGSLFALKRAGSPFQGKIVFTAVADEESGSDAGTVWLIENRKVAADYAIVSEPTSGWVEIGHRGIVWVETTFKGKASHASRPQVGVNAIHYAADAIAALRKIDLSARQEVFEIPTGSLSVTLISGGTKVNVIPDRCTLALDRRMLPIETVEGVVDQIRQAVAGAMGEGASFDLRVTKAWPPVLMEKDHLLVQAVQRAFQVVHGRPSGLRGKAGATDASFIQALANVPIVLYGPGEGRLAHTADEYVVLDDLEKASHIYTLATLDLLA